MNRLLNILSFISHSSKSFFISDAVTSRPLSREEAAPCAASSACWTFQQGTVLLAQLAAGGATGWYSCYTSRSPSTAARPRCAGCGVFTSTRSMCATWGAFSLIATGFADCPAIGQPRGQLAQADQSWIGASPVHGLVIFIFIFFSGVWKHVQKTIFFPHYPTLKPFIVVLDPFKTVIKIKIYLRKKKDGGEVHHCTTGQSKCQIHTK